MENQSNDPKKDPKQRKQTFGILLFEAGIEFAILIAAPLVAGIFAGQWLDAKTNHGFFVIIGILAGLAVSCLAIYKRIKDYKGYLDKK